MTELETVGLNKVRFLNLHMVNIKTLNAQNMPLIEVLWVPETDLTALDVSKCTHLRELNCRDTEISDLSVEGLILLERLDIDGTAIKHIDLTMLTKLKEVGGCNDNDRVVLTAEGVERD